MGEGCGSLQLNKNFSWFSESFDGYQERPKQTNSIRSMFANRLLNNIGGPWWNENYHPENLWMATVKSRERLGVLLVLGLPLAMDDSGQLFNFLVLVAECKIGIIIAFIMSSKTLAKISNTVLIVKSLSSDSELFYQPLT